MNKSFSVYRSSAGSGKTRTLAKAFLRLSLQYRVDYFKHILAVTFTNKASQEMKDRILEYLDDFAHGRSPALAEELQRELSMDSQTFRQNSQEVQSTLLHQYDNFGISTIDAFFQKVIRSFTREAGLVGDYRLEVDQDAVLEDVIDNLIDELGENKELTDWVVEFAKENLENERSWDVRYSLIDFAKEIFREEFKDIEDELLEKTKAPGFFKKLMHELKSKKFEFINVVKSKATEALNVIHQNNLSVSDFKYSGGPYNFLLKASRITSVRGFDEKEKGKRAEKEYQSPANWPDKATRASGLILELVASRLLPLMNDIIQYWHENYQIAHSAEAVLNNFYSFGLIADISRKLKEYKDENNLMLLADAPKFLNGVIRDSDTPFIYEKVGSFYRNYLIDEFQDTSGLQWQNFQPLIVNSLDQGYPSLVVGDVKQAIYRWRGGDLSLLQEKITNFIGSERVDIQELGNNYRSAPAIVSFNNSLFKNASQILSLESGMPMSTRAYEDVAQISSKTDGGFVEVHFFGDEKLMDDHGSESLARSWKDVALDQVPVTLEKLQEQGAALKDIAILVRKNDEGQKIAAFLLQYKNSAKAKPNCAYDVVSNESLRIDGAASVNLLLGAMRYLLNADDSIARAQLGYEFARLHEPDRELAEVFTVSNQSIFENNLPPAFTREKPALKKLPLIELTEILIGIFKLGTIAGELVYLQAFQDLVLEFNNRERNDLGAFLEWWEANKHKKSIQISGEVNAVQILTIHKSKGLQFKYVIIPFCSWSLDHEKWQAPNLWVTSGESPFKNAGYLPVRYSKSLEDTFFSEFYSAERTKIFLDNLNLLYVAFTRAESGLIVCAPSIDTRGTKGTIAGLLYQSIRAAEDLKDHWDEERLTWRSGAWPGVAVPEERDQSAVRLTEYLSSAWRDKLVIRQSGASWFQETVDPQIEKMTYGIYMHAVLSRMRYAEDLNTMLSQILHEGFITLSEKEPLERQLKDLLNNSKIAGWFSHDWEVRTEVPILLPGGEENRIDRLMLKGKKAVIVDFKTGGRKKNDEKQVLQYMDILRQMNFHEVEGYLLYLRDSEIIEVKVPRSKVVQRVKNKAQLELGL
ncbi:MAG: UvrD-helicase domain-containing protein [Cyclobacteriaceae bacterium]